MGRILNFVMTPARKLALKKAQRAAARAAKRKAVMVGRKKAVKKVAAMKLKRSASGLILRSNFKGKAGRQLKRATYATRLASSRSKYGKALTGEKILGELYPGLSGGQGVIRRRYADLTLGENITRNITRNIKINAALAPVAIPLSIGLAAGAVRVSARRNFDYSYDIKALESDSIKKAQHTKYQKMSV